MGRRLMLILTCALIVGLALPAYAEVQNVKVSGDMTMYGIGRRNFDGADVNKADADESHFASIIRLRIDADLTENVSTTLRLLNERDWGEEDENVVSSDADIVVDLASITLKEFLYSPLTLILGRQELHFGNDFIMGDPDRNNNAAGTTLFDRDLSSKKAFDAIRATLDYDPLVVDLIWAKIDENTVQGADDDEEKDDVDLFGVNARYDFGGNWSTIGELYYFSKVDNTTRDAGLASNKEQIMINNIGGRVEIGPIERLMLSGELAYQFGRNCSDLNNTVMQDHNAMAMQGIVSYALDMKYSPVLTAIYSYYSGDNVATNDDSEGWDPMYENQIAGHIANVLMDPSDLHVVDLRGSVVPLEDLTVTLDFVWLQFVEGYTTGADITTFDPSHTAIANAWTATGDNHVGNELDINLVYDYTEDVQLGLLAGMFFPGDAFDSKDTKNISEVIASVKVSF